MSSHPTDHVRHALLLLTCQRILERIRSGYCDRLALERELSAALEADESLHRLRVTQEAAAVAGQLGAALDAVWQSCAATLPDEVRAQVVAAREAWEGSTEEEV